MLPDRLLHLCNLHADFADGLVRRLQLLCHRDLRVAGEFARGCHAGLQFLTHLAELRRNRLHQMIDLRVYGLALRREGILHFLTHRG
jgi:hypothetical protein